MVEHGFLSLAEFDSEFGVEISDCNLVDSKRVRPILGRKACLGMKITKYLDNDQLNHPQTSDGTNKNQFVTLRDPAVLQSIIDLQLHVHPMVYSTCCVLAVFILKMH